MKAISLYQPHATAVAVRVKRFETRGKRTAHRGWFGVHAALNPSFTEADLALMGPAWSPLASRALRLTGWENAFPRGAVVAVARLVADHATSEITLTPADAPFGDFSSGRRAYELADVHFLPLPVPCRGWPGWFVLPPDVLGLTLAQMPAELLADMVFV